MQSSKENLLLLKDSFGNLTLEMAYRQMALSQTQGPF